jgi:Fe-S-cluster-containing hydrogenase component 2
VWISALEMIDDFPRADEATCITCFCCHEICPEKAIAFR